MPGEKELVLSSGAKARIYRGSPDARVGVIALHPWGPVGGSIHDPHVVTVVRLFSDAGAATARIAFRTGFSFGSSPLLDVKAAAQELLSIPNIERLLVVGYSYGSIVALAAPYDETTEDDQPFLGWISIAPPLDVLWALFLFNGKALLNKALQSTQKLPKLLIHPARDQFCSTSTFDSYFQSLPEPKTELKLPTAHHFDVAPYLPDAISNWLKSEFDANSVSDFVCLRSTTSSTST